MTVMKAIREVFRKIKEESGEYLSVAHGKRETARVIYFSSTFFVVGGMVSNISHQLLGSSRIFDGMALIALCLVCRALCRLDKHYPLRKELTDEVFPTSVVVLYRSQKNNFNKLRRIENE
jgi:hypothetical protein